MAREVVRITRDLLDDAIRDPRVRAALRSVADDLEPAVDRIAREVKAVAVAEALERTSGTRPGTKSANHIRRPYERVISTAADAVAREWGDVYQDRQAIFRRALAAAGVNL